MNIIDIINKKRLNLSLNYDELSTAFNGYLNKEIRDYQISSLLMAIAINGLSDEEVINLTDIFIKSGDILIFPNNEYVVDKHSTGGVGDKVTLILGPILAACGLKFPKMSGRSLGYTGGTIDKLESIPNIKLNLSKEEIIDQVNKIGLCITSQSENLVPLDKVIYAIRDTSGSVSSVPLIAISIMSKKVACGAKTVLIDIKCGIGALINKYEDAIELKRLMQLIANQYNINLIVEITEMNQPLGQNIGNALEIIEAIDILNGKKGLLTDLVIDFATKIIVGAKNITEAAAKTMVTNAIENKSALAKFNELITYQNGLLTKLKVSNNIIEIKAETSGILVDINADNLSKLVFNLGAGRLNTEDKIDHQVGIIINKQINDSIKIGDILAYLYVNIENVIYNVNDIFEIKGE